MTQRKFWLATALVALMIGAGAPARAQQYYYPYKPSDKPAVVVDMSVLGDPGEASPSYATPADPETAAEVDEEPLAPAAKPKPAHAKTRLADYQYIRPSLVIEPPQEAAAPAAATENKPIAPPQAPAPVKTAKKKRFTKTAAEPQPPKPSLVTTRAPTPVPPPPAPAQPASSAIVSLPPKMEAAPVVTEHHDIPAATPIISMSPDASPARVPAPVPAPQPVMTAIPEPARAVPVVAEPEKAPSSPEKAPIASAPAPEPSKSVETPVAAPEEHLTPPAPEPSVATAPAESTPGEEPLPDIKVIHPPDYPEDTTPPPVAEPDLAKAPRDEPLPLPKSKKPGKTTAEMLAPAPAPHAAPEKMPEPAATKAAEEPATPAPEAQTAVAEPTPPDTTAPQTDNMPVVPAMADLTLNFEGNSSDLTREAQKKLDAVIKQMDDMTDGRLQVRGFATGEDGSKSSARRIALSRVLTVRAYLMDKGVKPTRVDVRALGTDTDRSPLDRVDLIFVR